MRVGNETGDGSEDGEGFDLEMGGSRDDHVLVESDEGVVLLVTIEVLDDSGSEEVVEGLLSFLEELRKVRKKRAGQLKREKARREETRTNLHVSVRQSRNSLVDDDHRTTDSTSITGDVDDSMMGVDVDGDELGHLSCSTKLPEVGNESNWRGRETDDVSVDVDHEGSRTVEFVSGDERAVWEREKGEETRSDAIERERGERASTNLRLRADTRSS